ncbi:MAG: hypothetical protein JW704_13350, partial [Anaerolineaceae bacterium]|nr:hypothetical protein [Anaerolineaceae bacterium]
AMDNLKQLETQMKAQQKLLNALTNQRDSLIQSIARLVELIKARSEEQTHLKNLLKEAEHIEKAHQTHLETVQKLENMEAKSINFHDYQARRTAPMMTIEAERVRLEAEYSQLESMRTVTEGAEKELSLLEPKLSSDTIKMGQIKDAICERADLESDLKAKERQLAQLQVDNESLRSAMNDLDERIKSLEPVEGSVCPTCGQQLNPAKRKKLIVELKTTGKQLGDNYRKNKAELKTGSELVRTLTEKISTMGYLDADLREVTRTVDQLETRITQIRQQIADWHSTGKQRLDDIKDSLDNNSYAMDAQAQLQMIDKELHALGYDAAAHEAVRLLIQDAKPGEEEFRELGKARSALVPLEREMKGYAEQLKQEKSNLNGLEKEIGQAESNYSEAVSKLPDVEQAYNDMLNLQQQERQQHMEVGAARQ